MDTFSVTKENDTLHVRSNTFWSCSVYGNFTLSKNSGIGDSDITIGAPKELPYAYGTVIFSYGDERCEYPSMDIFYNNDCYIATEPMFNECSNGNILKLTFKENGEAISVKIYSNGIWSKSGSVTSYKNGDELLISASEGTITITPSSGCNNKVYIKLEKE